MPITQAAPSAPPRKGARTTPASSPKLSAVPGPLYGKAKDRAEGLQGWMQLATLACISKGWLADAGAIAKHGESVSTEIARTAEQAEPLGKVLDWLSMSGPYAALFGAVLPFAAQVAMNHKVIPEAFALEGVVPPDVLEAEVKRDIMAMRTAALLAQQEAEAQLSQMQALLNGTGETE